MLCIVQVCLESEGCRQADVVCSTEFVLCIPLETKQQRSLISALQAC